MSCAGSRLKNPLSVLLFDNSQFRKLGEGNGYQVFVLPTRAICLYLTVYFANNEVLPPFFDGECLYYIVWSILID